MAYNIYHQPNPFIESLWAYGAGFGQANRQAQMVEDQWEFQARQANADRLLGQFNQAISFAENAGLQHAGYQAGAARQRSAQNFERDMVGFRADTAAQQAMNLRDINQYGMTTDQIETSARQIGIEPNEFRQRRQAEMLQANVEAANNAVLQYGQQQVDQLAQQAGLQRTWSEKAQKEIIRTDTGVQDAMADSSMNMQDRIFAIQTAGEKYKRLRKSLTPVPPQPPGGQLAQAMIGNGGSIPIRDPDGNIVGYSTIKGFEANGTPKFGTYKPSASPPQFDSPESTQRYLESHVRPMMDESNKQRGVLIVNPDGSIKTEEWNKSAEDTLNIPEIVGKLNKPFNDMDTGKTRYPTAHELTEAASGQIAAIEKVTSEYKDQKIKTMVAEQQKLFDTGDPSRYPDESSLVVDQSYIIKRPDGVRIHARWTNSGWTDIQIVNTSSPR